MSSSIFNISKGKVAYASSSSEYPSFICQFLFFSLKLLHLFCTLRIVIQLFSYMSLPLLSIKI